MRISRVTSFLSFAYSKKERSTISFDRSFIEMAVSVKVHFYHPFWLRPNVYRIELSEPYTVSDLGEKLEQLADGAKVSNLRWRDDEKDLIVLKTDEDLRLAVNHIRTAGLSYLSLNADVTAKPTCACVGRKETTGDVVDTSATEEQLAARPEPSEKVADGKKSSDYPLHKLPGGGQYCGYVRTTDADGKTVERELTRDEAHELLRTPTMPSVPSVFGGFDDVFGWPALRRPRYPAVGYAHPLSLPYFF